MKALKPKRTVRTASVVGGVRRANVTSQLSHDDRQKIYHDTRWRKLRKLVFSVQSSCCTDGCPSIAEVLDHIIPISQHAGMARAYDITNVQPLCRVCHHDKTDMIDAPNREQRAYRHDLAHLADRRPIALTQWAEHASHDQHNLVGPMSGKRKSGPKARPTFKGDLSC